MKRMIGLRRLCLVTGSAVLLLGAADAHADDDEQVPADQPPAGTYTYEDETWDDKPDHLATRDGMGFAIGGGVMNFIDEDTRNFTSVGGAWDARLTYGTRTAVGAEIAYIGSAQSIDALRLDSSAALLGSGGEAAARVNIGALGVVQPYALAGIGVTNYSLVNEDFNTSNVDDSETVFHVPLGAGVGFRAQGLLIDLRGTYRPAFQDGLIDNQEDQIGETNPGVAQLDSWAATASAGVEF